MKFWRFKDHEVGDIILVSQGYENIRIYVKDNLDRVISYYSYWSEIDAGKMDGRYEFIDEFKTFSNFPSSEFFNI